MKNEVATTENLPTTYKAEVNIYEGASTLKITDAEQTKLLASFETKEIEIRPDGLIYLPQTFWRKRLNESFGIGQWCIIPKHSNIDKPKNKLYLHGVLMVRGTFVSEAMGEAEYHENNSMQSWASVWESAKSDCITRCCKDLGIASELWQPEFVKGWVSENAVKVWIEKKDKTKGVAWRKKTSEKLWNETGIVQEKIDSSKITETKKPEVKKSDSKPGKESLTPKDKKAWINTVQKLAGEKVTIKVVEDYYNLTPEHREQLLAEAFELINKNQAA